jgi:hypothetical protein
MTASESDLWVFRDGKKNMPGQSVLRELEIALRDLCRLPNDSNAQLTALIQAGEMEAAVADHGSPTAPYFASLTDAVADIGFGMDVRRLPPFLADLPAQNVPETLSFSTPEGFYYYALHPLDFGRHACTVVKFTGPVAIIGVRSIGTTLSAVVAAGLRAAGCAVERITVRPSGHPYDRVTQFSDSQLAWIARNRAKRALFLVVDEGPGRSGSTFLSVGEALLSAGVAWQQITLAGSRKAEPEHLCARDSMARWKNFNFVVALPATHIRFENHAYLGSGEWRREFLQPGRDWPACWLQTERLKFLSPDRKRLFKFEGFGRMGAVVRERARSIHEAGFGPAMVDEGDGFTSYALIKGPPLQASDICPKILETIAQYCAFRSREFTISGAASGKIAEALRFNVQTEFGVDIDFDSQPVPAPKLVLADGRMQPHEWIRGRDRMLLKVDATTHGDDHFFPGPTDIAWDLAGAVVEWSLDSSGVDFLVRRFQQLTGDDVRNRLSLFIFAYTVFRLATWKMALSTVINSPEESRVRRAYAFYKSLAERQLSTRGHQPKRTIAAPALAT